MLKQSVMVMILMAAWSTSHAAALAIHHAWARATVPGASTGAVFGEIHNVSTDPVSVVAITTPVAARAEIHESVMEGDMMRMRHIEHLAIAPGQRVALKPGSFHIMLMGLSDGLKGGTTFPLTIEFSDGERVETRVIVGDVGQMEMPPQDE